MSATQATHGMSPWQALVFPALFTAGMAAIDTADSVLMVHANGWAFSNPRRKLGYNPMVTALSVTVAVVIGGIELLGLLDDRLALHGAVWVWVARSNNSVTYLGFAVIAVFAACWLAFGLVQQRQQDNCSKAAGSAPNTSGRKC